MDFANVERISASYWRNSPLSVARLTGACILQGRTYVVCPVTNDLVREDVFNRELKTNKSKKAAWMKAEKEKWESMQSNLF